MADKGEPYTCELCRGTFLRGHDDDVAHREAVENFGVSGDAPGMVLVCDDCYREVLADLRVRVDN